MTELSGEVELFVWKVAMDTVTPKDGAKLIRKAIALEKRIEAMRKCYIKLTDNGCNVEDDHWIYCADSKLMREFDEAFEDKDE